MTSDEALLYQVKLSNLDEVNPFNLKSFHQWQKNAHFPLAGDDRSVWGNLEELDDPFQKKKENTKRGLRRSCGSQ